MRGQLRVNGLVPSIDQEGEDEDSDEKGSSIKIPYEIFYNGHSIAEPLFMHDAYRNIRSVSCSVFSKYAWRFRCG
jgi:hypothetical protein